MTNSSTLETLKALKLSAMASELRNQLENPNSYSQLGFEEQMALLVDAEWNRRQTNKLTRYVHGARFAIPGVAVEDIEYFEDRRLDKTQTQRFATCKYIEEGHLISFFAELPVTVKLISPVRSETPLVENSNPSDTFACRSCWMN